MMFVYVLHDLAAKDLLLVVTFRSFSVQGISGSKNREFPNSEPFLTARFLRSSAISSRNIGEED